jgi:hypothetical protein
MSRSRRLRRWVWPIRRFANGPALPSHQLRGRMSSTCASPRSTRERTSVSRGISASFVRAANCARSGGDSSRKAIGRFLGNPPPRSSVEHPRLLMAVVDKHRPEARREYGVLVIVVNTTVIPSSTPSALISSAKASGPMMYLSSAASFNQALTGRTTAPGS